MFNNKKDDDILEYMLFRDGTEKDADSVEEVSKEEIDDEEQEEESGLFGGLYGLLDDDKEDNEERVQELKNLGLDDEEIRLVIEEGYDPSDFEDDIDEKDDDDYYGEDF